MDDHSERWIATAGEDREPKATHDFLHSPASSVVLDACGLATETGHDWWALTRAPMPSPDRHPAGDIDLIVGRLARRRVSSNVDSTVEAKHESGSASLLIEIPNSVFNIDLSTLLAMQIKCAYVARPHASIHADHASPKKHRRLEKQLNKLHQMGFDRVALLDIVGGIPSLAQNVDSLPEASDSFRATQSHGRYLPSNQGSTHWFAPAGTGRFMVTIGGILGASESTAGYVRSQMLEPPTERGPFVSSAEQSRRRQTVDHVKKLAQTALNQIRVPQFGPLVIDHCPRCKTWGLWHPRSVCLADTIA